MTFLVQCALSIKQLDKHVCSLLLLFSLLLCHRILYILYIPFASQIHHHHFGHYIIIIIMLVIIKFYQLYFNEVIIISKNLWFLGHPYFVLNHKPLSQHWRSLTVVRLSSAVFLCLGGTRAPEWGQRGDQQDGTGAPSMWKFRMLLGENGSSYFRDIWNGFVLWKE